ncbi:glycosyl transferases group 1 family protein [Geobacillus kaustophilus]|uniref:Glycosyl transferases group 1 family protein n=1 Tax=Geobacillus kaustophilus TaxID=1462 RepID=A0A0D8BVY4_GEOKU|nr:glycosyltransferase family 1 protein [Geobacillus kaustophilus]KJE27557.1 glycosyl transferases group 1 family protein [Geobacillus kaustophilus]
MIQLIKIGIDLRVLDSLNITGLGRYALNLTQELIKFEEEEYYLIGNVHRSELECAKKIKVPVELPYGDMEFANKLLSLIGYVEDLDMIFSPFYPLPERRNFKGIVTIHDLIPLRLPDIFNNTSIYDFYDIYMRDCAKHVDHIITVSNSTKQDIMELYEIEEEKISVVYLSSHFKSCFSNEADGTTQHHTLMKYGISQSYILSICTLEPRKNLNRLLKAYEIIRTNLKEELHLVFVGGLGMRSEELIREIEKSQFKDSIIMTGYVPDEDLPILYSNAEVFVYPSLYEGFGLPVLEAMGYGVPVVTSNVSSLPEVGGEAALYCDPYDVESIAYTIEKVLLSPTLQKQLREKSLERSKLFSWEKTALQTRDVFLKCFNES